jgi:hypothetical protein
MEWHHFLLICEIEYLRAIQTPREAASSGSVDKSTICASARGIPKRSHISGVRPEVKLKGPLGRAHASGVSQPLNKPAKYNAPLSRTPGCSPWSSS